MLDWNGVNFLMNDNMLNQYFAFINIYFAGFWTRREVLIAVFHILKKAD